LDSLRDFILIAPVLLFAMVAHEYAHGYAALRQGDPTAYQLGRLTWNPIKHVDPFMTVLLPLITWFGSGGNLIFGGAKPVPVSPRNYRNYKRGDIIVSLAGVSTNLVLAVLSVLLIVVVGLVGRGAAPAVAEPLGALQYMMWWSVRFNLVLVAFNLLPIPPLDGSHVAKYLLPPAWALRYQQIGAYGMLILLLLLTVGRPVLAAWMMPVSVASQFAVGVFAPYVVPSSWWQ
jgi:Zn-dependent protease